MRVFSLSIIKSHIFKMFTRPLARFFATTSGIPAALSNQLAIHSGAVCSARLVTETNTKFNSIELEMGLFYTFFEYS